MTTPLTVEHSNALNAWQQQEGESALAYLYFRTFLDLGPQRSILETVQTLVKDDQVKRTPDKATLTKLSQTNRWHYRAELYDRWELANQTRMAAEQRREEMRIHLEAFAQFQTQMGKDLSALASKVLAKTDLAIDNSADDQWTLDRASRFMQVLNQTATTAAGLWSEGLGVERLNQNLAEMDARVTEAVVEADKIS